MNKYNSIFGQILKLFPRFQFEALVKETGASRNAKGFSCWDQFVAMLFCQLGQAHSLREICGGLATSLGKMIHLGLRKAPSRSTLAYANEHRPWQLYEKLFYHILGLCKHQFPGKHNFRFKNKLLSFDATVIKLCLSLYDWAKFRRTKGAIKLHLLLDHAGYLPQFVNITTGKVHEVNILKTLSFDPGAIGLPLEGVGLIIAVDRILDMMRTCVNVWSDSCGTVIIAKSEGETGLKVLRKPTEKIVTV